MASRVLHSEEHGLCGCPTAKTMDVKSECNEHTYSDCPVTLDSIPLKSTRRYCLNFYRIDCEDCDGCGERFYEHIRLVKAVKSNPPCVTETEGNIRISQTHMNPKTGKFTFSIDTNDDELKSGERFLIEVWAKLPNTEERSISGYVSIK